MKRRTWIKEMAQGRIRRLFELAEQEFSDHPERSDRYVLLAMKIGTRYRVRIPKDLKLRFCKNCNSFLVPGRNARVRLNGNYIITTCLNCNKPMRRPYPKGIPKISGHL